MQHCRLDYVTLRVFIPDPHRSWWPLGIVLQWTQHVYLRLRLQSVDSILVFIKAQQALPNVEFRLLNGARVAAGALVRVVPRIRCQLKPHRIPFLPSRLIQRRLGCDVSVTDNRCPVGSVY